VLNPEAVAGIGIDCRHQLGDINDPIRCELELVWKEAVLIPVRLVSLHVCQSGIRELIDEKIHNIVSSDEPDSYPKSLRILPSNMSLAGKKTNLDHPAPERPLISSIVLNQAVHHVGYE
jgi:hypothetical protein